ncbi:MAG: hypothetical protein JOZ05_16805 [Acetobacteraceae bacterium]|nr:hypothetical protein [Acetobacteraceae bacterium]
MTSRFLIAVLPDEAYAERAARTFEALHEAGAIVLYGMALVASDPDGCLFLRSPAAPGPLGSASRVLAELFVQLGSPSRKPGWPPGSSPACLDTLTEFASLGLDFDLIEAASAAMSGASVAVVAEIGEHWLGPVDAALAQLGGIIIRRFGSDTALQRTIEEIEALDMELQALEQELDRLGESATKTIVNRAKATRGRLLIASQRAEGMRTRLEQETEAKLAILIAQQERVGAQLDAKVEQETRIGEGIMQLQAEARQRSAMLARSIALAREALGPAGPEHAGNG